MKEEFENDNVDSQSSSQNDNDGENQDLMVIQVEPENEDDVPNSNCSSFSYETDSCLTQAQFVTQAAKRSTSDDEYVGSSLARVLNSFDEQNHISTQAPPPFTTTSRLAKVSTETQTTIPKTDIAVQCDGLIDLPNREGQDNVGDDDTNNDNELVDIRMPRKLALAFFQYFGKSLGQFDDKQKQYIVGVSCRLV